MSAHDGAFSGGGFKDVHLHRDSWPDFGGARGGARSASPAAADSYDSDLYS